jgi:Tol biopolymer transport system component
LRQDKRPWSPDGRRLAYLRFSPNAGALLVRSLDGGGERKIASVFYTRHGLAARHLDWSPDGRFLAVDDAEAAGRALGLFLVSLETGEKRLTQPADDIIGDLWPRFSPDGKTVSFVRAFRRNGMELFAVSREGGGAPVQLTSDGKQVGSQDWMPDGKSLVFSSDRGGEFRLWRLDYPKARNVPARWLSIYGDFPLQISIARQAATLAYSVLQQDRNIWRLDLQAKGREIRWLRVVASSGQDVSPQYSPQGDRIAFRSDRSGEEQLWVADAAGGDSVQITHGVLKPSVPRWAPDGRSIAFNNSANGDLHMARLKADGGWNVSPLNATGIHPVFSPDGQWIYAGAAASIVRLPAAGGPSTEIIRMRGISLDVSRDGRYVYFVRDPSGVELWRVEAASGKAEKVLDGLVPFCSSCRALGPTGIYYLAADEAPSTQALHFRDLATGRDRKVVDYPEPLTPIGSGPFSLSPDRRYLLCVRLDTSNADIFRVEPLR